MKIKNGDNVKVLSGKDRGKTGKVTQVLTMAGRGTFVVVEGMNQRKKHLRTRGSESGRSVDFSAPMDISKVMLVDAKTNRPTRVGFSIQGGEKKRVARASGEMIA